MSCVKFDLSDSFVLLNAPYNLVCLMVPKIRHMLNIPNTSM